MKLTEPAESCFKVTDGTITGSKGSMCISGIPLLIFGRMFSVNLIKHSLILGSSRLHGLMYEAEKSLSLIF